jgi:tryptophan synthase alpha chain
LSPVPIAIGFGISESKHVAHFRKRTDGVVVGSALVKRIGELQSSLVSENSRKRALSEVKAFVRQLKTE